MPAISSDIRQAINAAVTNDDIQWAVRLQLWNPQDTMSCADRLVEAVSVWLHEVNSTPDALLNPIILNAELLGNREIQHGPWATNWWFLTDKRTGRFNRGPLSYEGRELTVSILTRAAALVNDPEHQSPSLAQTLLGPR